MKFGGLLAENSRRQRSLWRRVPDDKFPGISRSQVPSAGHGRDRHAVVGQVRWRQPIQALHTVIGNLNLICWQTIIMYTGLWTDALSLTFHYRLFDDDALYGT